MKLPIACPVYVVGDAIPRMIGSESKQPPVGVRRSATGPFAYKVCRCCFSAGRDRNAKQKGYHQYSSAHEVQLGIRWQFVVYFCRIEASLPEKTAARQHEFCGETARKNFGKKLYVI
jgi:hypothetical protein